MNRGVFSHRIAQEIIDLVDLAYELELSSSMYDISKAIFVEGALKEYAEKIISQREKEADNG